MPIGLEDHDNKIPFLICAGFVCSARKYPLRHLRERAWNNGNSSFDCRLKSVSSTNRLAESAERRKSGRFAVSASTEVLESRTSTRLNVRVSDLGMGACYIDTVSPVLAGTSLMLSLTSENHNVRAKADVVGMGLAKGRSGHLAP